MKTKIVYKNSEGKIAIVGVGFSWGAFFLGPMWAIIKRQWLLFICLSLATISINFIVYVADGSSGVAGAVLYMGSFLYMIACGLYGNRWHQYFLERSGYRKEGVI